MKKLLIPAIVAVAAIAVSSTAQTPGACPVIRPDTSTILINNDTGKRIYRSQLQSIIPDIQSVHVRKDTAYVILKQPATAKGGSTKTNISNPESSR